jgi:putative endonuclease
MAQHHQVGIKGEKEACLFLQEKGYNILHVNWRYKHWEVDIIASKEDELIFCEVKCRTSILFGLPESFVTRAKQRRIIAAADAYLQQNPVKKEIRFDILSLLLLPENELTQLQQNPFRHDFQLTDAHHIKNAVVNGKNMVFVILHLPDAFTAEWICF